MPHALVRLLVRLPKGWRRWLLNALHIRHYDGIPLYTSPNLIQNPEEESSATRRA